MKIEVCFTPDEFQDEQYKNYTAVVIDVLRATTSIATAFHNGCQQIIPVKTVEQAFEQKDQYYPEAILTGERKGVIIPGFALGNSPLEYHAENVGGKTIVMSTTNGTVALNCAASASKVYTAALVNAKAVSDKLKAEGNDVVIVCAGTDGRFSVEDTVCAGLIVYNLGFEQELSDKALVAAAMYRGLEHDLVERVSQSSHAKYLANLGFIQDVNICLQRNTLAVAPVFKNGVLSNS